MMDQETAKMQETAPQTEDYVVCKYADVPEAPPKYLWEPYIPFGMVTVVQGMPGSGKSTFLADIVACATNGKTLPDGTVLPEKLNAVYQCSEAGGPGVVKLMLQNAGADLNAVSFVQGDYVSLCDGRIRRLIEETNAKLLVVDPMQEYLESSMFQAQSSRKEITNVSLLAEKTGCAVVLIGHFTKYQNKEELYQGMGSGDIVGLARSVLHVRRLDRTSPIRYVSQIKCSCAAEAGAYAFEIVNFGEARWIGPVDDSDMMALSEEEKLKRPAKQEAAINDLRNLLSKGDMDASKALHKMQLKGHSQSTVRLIKKEAGVESKKRSDGKWVWSLKKVTFPSGAPGAGRKA